MRIIPITCARATQVHGTSYVLVATAKNETLVGALATAMNERLVGVLATAMNEELVGVLLNYTGSCCDYVCISSLINGCL